MTSNIKINNIGFKNKKFKFFLSKKMAEYNENTEANYDIHTQVAISLILPLWASNTEIWLTHLETGFKCHKNHFEYSKI